MYEPLGGRFNEAPIHESGKSDRSSGAARGPPASMRPRFMNRGSRIKGEPTFSKNFRFNEAPIHESGKWECDPQFLLPDACASMRPRFMNRGSARSPVDRAARGLARFNEAPIHESGKCTRHHQGCRGNGASMRPRFMNRGSDMQFFSDCRAEVASMRPRFMNRGSSRQARQGPQAAPASMRPRFMNRGSGSWPTAFVGSGSRLQ